MIYSLFVIYIYTSILSIIPAVLLPIIRYSIYLLIFLYLLKDFIAIRINKEIGHYLLLISCLIIYSFFISILNNRNVSLAFGLLKQNFFFIFLLFIKNFTKGHRFQKIIKHVYFASLIQALWIIAAFVCIKYFNISFFRNFKSDVYISSDGMTSNGLRIFSRLQPFLLVGFAYNLLCRKSFQSRVELILFLFAIYISKTLMFYCCLLFIIGSSIFINKKWFRKNFGFIVFSVMVSFFLFLYFIDFGIFGTNAKISSFTTKQSQLYSLLDLPFNKVLLGNGFGYEFNFDHRMTGDVAIELVQVYWIATIGIIGTYLQLIALFYIFRDFHKKRNNNKITNFIIVSHAAVFLTSLSNNYICSGSTAYMMILLFFCLKEAMIQWTKRFQLLR